MSCRGALARSAPICGHDVERERERVCVCVCLLCIVYWVLCTSRASQRDIRVTGPIGHKSFPDTSSTKDPLPLPPPLPPPPPPPPLSLLLCVCVYTQCACIYIQCALPHHRYNLLEHCMLHATGIPPGNSTFLTTFRAGQRYTGSEARIKGTIPSGIL